MAERTEYAVLRFLDQNGYCHVVNDFVKGSSFMQYVKAEAVITKRMFFFWMTELAYQMEQYYKCEEGRAYGYVNPYAVIVTEEQEILLLDTADQGNEEIVQRMQKKKVRALFVRREYVLSQKMRTEDDWYGFGKLIQFMTDRCCISERMTVKEERTVRRIAEKCISGKYEGVRGWREVKKELRRLKNMEEGRVEKSGKRREKSEVQRMLLGAAAIVAAVAAVITMMQGREHIGKADSTDTVLAEELQGGEEEEDSLEELASGKELNEIQEKSGRVSLEMGLLYFVELEDFEKSYEYLKEAAAVSELAECYLVIAENLQVKGMPIKKSGLESVVKKGESELEVWREGGLLRGKEHLYGIPFLCIYGKMDTVSGYQKVIEIGEWIRTENQDEVNLKTTALEKKLGIWMAEAYEKLQNTEEAIEEYEKLKEIENEDAELESIYLKLMDLYDENKEREKAWDICREAVEKSSESEKIRIAYIKRQCADENIEREICAETIKKAVSELPGLTDNEEFQELKENYKITIEGDTVCVGEQ